MTPEFHPVQNETHPRDPRYVDHLPVAVTQRAYEVYCHVFAPQPALVQGNCRGGFSVGEIIAFLYAATFPKAEWRDRVNEAFERRPR